MTSLAPPATTSSSSSASTKDAFEASLKSRDPRNNYIAHLKIWESPDESEKATGAAAQPKARYLILAVQRDTGRVTLNKAKRNANGSYSVGKDWDVNGLRGVEVIDVSMQDQIGPAGLISRQENSYFDAGYLILSIWRIRKRKLKGTLEEIIAWSSAPSQELVQSSLLRKDIDP